MRFSRNDKGASFFEIFRTGMGQSKQFNLVSRLDKKNQQFLEMQICIK